MHVFKNIEHKLKVVFQQCVLNNIKLDSALRERQNLKTTDLGLINKERPFYRLQNN